MKIKLVFHTVGRVLLLEAALMLLPLAVSLIYGESCSLSFVISAAAAAAVGAALKFSAAVTAKICTLATGLR